MVASLVSQYYWASVREGVGATCRPPTESCTPNFHQSGKLHLKRLPMIALSDFENDMINVESVWWWGFLELKRKIISRAQAPSIELRDTKFTSHLFEDPRFNIFKI